MLKIAVPAPSAGTRVRCYCKDCQTAARLQDRDQDLLTDAGGTDIWQTTPDLIDITDGASDLRILRLSPRGAFRWYAGCCGTLMFNTIRNMKLPFVGITLRKPEVAQTDELLGPVRCHAFTDSARKHPDAPTKDRGMGRAGLLALRRAFLTWVSGRSALSPLRQPDGTPIAPIEVVSLDQRNAALPDHLR